METKSTAYLQPLYIFSHAVTIRGEWICEQLTGGGLTRQFLIAALPSLVKAKCILLYRYHTVVNLQPIKWAQRAHAYM